MAEEKSALVVPDEIVIDKILFIRGKKVMIDRDLAELYGVATKQMNQQVKRNLKRFPEDPTNVDPRCTLLAQNVAPSSLRDSEWRRNFE